MFLLVRDEKGPLSLTFEDRHIPGRNAENANDEQHRRDEADARFGRKAALGVGGLQGVLSWTRGA